MIIKRIAALLLLAGTLFGTGCQKSLEGTGSAQDTLTKAGQAKKITPKEAHQMMEEGEDFILLDVRTQQEYSESHIEGAMLIPDNQISSKGRELLPDQDAVILVYCRSGARSAQSAKTLAQMGYTNVYDFGGIQSWPYGTVGGQ